MSTQGDNAQGTLAATAGFLLGTGGPAALTQTGTTQIIGALFVFTGAVVAVVRAWLRAP